MVQVMQRATAARRKRLRDAGLRVTQHRLRVLESLEEAQRPLTHLELHAQFDAGLVDRTTVFRNLASLVRVGLVSRADNGDRLWRYALVEHAPPSARFECERCGEVSELPRVTVSFASGEVPRAVSNWRCAVKFVGLCDECN